jgi:hypothetical protein
MYFKVIFILFNLTEKCEDVVTPNDGTIILTSDGTITRAEITCDVGYSITGTVELNCASDGTWSGDMPSCGMLF